MSKPTILMNADGIVVVDKPVGWVAHAAHKSETHDVLAWLGEQTGRHRRLAPIHRLDRDTSGVLLYAIPGANKKELLEAFSEHTVEKRYLALVYGRTNPKGVVNKALSDSGKGKGKGNAGREAVTNYKTLEELGGFSLVDVRPETGRKHQIRRHLQHIGHAVVGDTRYRPRSYRPVPAFPGRLWLHALSLTMPDGTVYASPLPAELEEHLAVLRGEPTESEPEA